MSATCKPPVGTWDGKTYRISIDGDCHTFTYRTDYFADGRSRQGLEGRRLQGEWGVPSTWQQVQAAPSSSRASRSTGQDAYGFLDPLKGWGGFGFYFLGRPRHGLCQAPGRQGLAVRRRTR